MHSPELGLRCPCVACRVALHRQEAADAVQVWRTGSIERRPRAGHGTRACYARGCPCAACVAANRRYARRAARRARRQHGTYARYRAGCRCTVCRAASARARRLQRWFARGCRAGGRTLQGHGTRACYKRGCRRSECVEAFRRYKRELKARRRERESIS